MLPQQIAGNHGAGVVMGAGEGVGPEPGTLVAFSYYNTWAEYASVPAEWLIPLPSDYPLEKAGQLLNPDHSVGPVGGSSQVQPGQWVAVTAANSSVATMVVQFAQRRGVNVIPLGRQLPGDSSLRTRIMDLTGGHGLHGVIDCVGGRLLQDLMACLAPGGQVIIFGGMSDERLTLHNYDVLLKVVTIKPYIYRFFGRPPHPPTTRIRFGTSSTFSGVKTSACRWRRISPGGFRARPAAGEGQELLRVPTDFPQVVCHSQQRIATRQSGQDDAAAAPPAQARDEAMGEFQGHVAIDHEHLGHDCGVIAGMVAFQAEPGVADHEANIHRGGLMQHPLRRVPDSARDCRTPT